MSGPDAKDSFFNRLLAYMKRKEFISDECKRPERHYPLYWLAPAIDRGIKRVRLSSLLNCKEHELDSKIYYYSRISKLLVMMLSFFGLRQREGKEPLVSLVRIEGRYIVEKGHYRIRLAAFLNRDHVLARVIEYDYASLKKRMLIQLNVYGGIVGVAGAEKGSCSYYGVSPENAEVLISRHKVPVEKPIAVFPNKPAAGLD